jgi:glycosyltransferase involved in cell wall biosynthesis
VKIVKLYNQQRSLFSGEETVVHTTASLIEKNGDAVKVFIRSSRGLEKSLRKKIGVFWSGIYSRSAYHEMVEILKSEKPDIVHVHNLYPQFSPSVLVACRRKSVPVVMTVHNFLLTCPNWYHIHRGQVCERCLGGREYCCIIQNCRENICESVGYAVRNFVARKLQLFHDNVTLFIAPTGFVKHRLCEAGFRDERIAVIPNMVSSSNGGTTPPLGKYIAFAGRISPEKGIDTLLKAAGKTALPVHIAGDATQNGKLVESAPSCARLVGHLQGDQLSRFYRGARFAVVPSICFETFGLAAAEAMKSGLPVIASDIGGLPEIVDDGVTGLLFKAGDFKDLADKMKILWDSPELCLKMGRAGREKATREYSEEVYKKRLIAAYEGALGTLQDPAGEKKQGGA